MRQTAASHPEFAVTPTSICCSPMCPNGCSVIFCENIFQFSRNDSFRSIAEMCNFSP